MREGQVVSILRPASPAECLQRGIAPPAVSSGPELLKLQVSAPTCMIQTALVSCTCCPFILLSSLAMSCFAKQS